MAQTREIEKLQRRWQENPLGLTFAPLAEAYRKEGIFADALELLEIGLSQHPNYVPAHIVRGRCYLDIDDAPRAEAAFLRVTELDPENAIALKGLADIAERNGRYRDAVNRLERLLDFDRSNEEALLQLERLRALLAAPVPANPAPEAAAPPAPPAVAAEPLVAESPAAEPPPVEAVPMEPEAPAEVTALLAPAAPAPAAEPGSTLSTDELMDTLLGVEPASPAEPPKAEILDVEPTDVEVHLFSPADLAGPMDAEPDRPVAEPLSPAPEPSDAFEPPAVTSGDGGLGPIPTEPAEPEPPEPAPSAGPVEPEPVEIESGTAADDWLEELAGRSAEASFDPPAEAEPVAGPAEPLAAVDESGRDQAAGGDELEQTDPDLVVTETMAEIFLRQGHRELALAVYTQLQTRDPSNARIRAAAERLEAELRPGGTAPTLPAYAAVLTGGQSVRSYFESLLAATRPGAGGRAGGGLSLGAVFGDERTVASPPPGPDAAGGESFDEFFAGPARPSSGSAAAGRGESSGDPVEDIEEFNSWLRGLKR